MPNENVTLEIVISSITGAALDQLSAVILKDPSEVASFILTEGFSNLATKTKGLV